MQKILFDPWKKSSPSYLVQTDNFQTKSIFLLKFIEQ